MWDESLLYCFVVDYNRGLGHVENRHFVHLLLVVMIFFCNFACEIMVVLFWNSF